MLAGIDDKVVEKALANSEEFKKLYTEHVELEEKLNKMVKSSKRSDDMEAERKRLKKIKLAGKDRMHEIILSL